MVLAVPVAHGAAEAAPEERLQVGEVGVFAGLRYHLDRAVGGREELLNGVELVACDRLVDSLAAELLEPEVSKIANSFGGLQEHFIVHGEPHGRAVAAGMVAVVADDVLNIGWAEADVTPLHTKRVPIDGQHYQRLALKDIAKYSGLSLAQLKKHQAEMV